MRPAPRQLSTVIVAVAVTALVACAAATAQTPPIALGDGHLTTSSPRAGWVYACGPRPAGAPSTPRQPWIGRRSWDPARKPVVDGRVSVVGARFRLSSGAVRAFRGDAR